MTPEAASNAAAAASNKDVGKFVDLPDAVDGKVVTRFPPEASGYLHIGHAKAALLNEHYARSFHGTLLLRFDDTNPAKEKEDFEHVILDDLKLLEVRYDRLSYTSDYFDKLLDLCEQMLRAGLAYVDDTDPEKMKEEREAKTPSQNRDNPVEKNMQMWAEMKNATEHGKKCAVRAKITMESPNGCMRDPTIYRCKAESHPRTKDKYKVYPTYDFACPIVDSIEGVTHALRTTEYFDRDPQYYWFIEQLNLRRPFIYSYGRLSMMNTVLSKRKLAWFVEQGLVDGWDDPRFPTVRGILRHGLTVEGLKSFIIAQGSSRNVIQMEWDKIWSFNKKVIDPVAPRYVSVLPRGCVPVEVDGVAAESTKDVALHPKDEKIGLRPFRFGPRLIIDYIDAEAIRENETTTFVNWGNMLIRKIDRDANGNICLVTAALQLDNTDYKKTTKITWLAAPSAAKTSLPDDLKSHYDSYFTPCVLVYFDHIISKPNVGKDEDFRTFIDYDNKFETCMLAEPHVRNLKRGDIIQFLRRGFFICDQPYAAVDPLTSKPHRPCVLFYIPDGRKINSIQKELVPNCGGYKDNAPKQFSVVVAGGAGDSKPVETKTTAAKTTPNDALPSDASSSIDHILITIKKQGDTIRNMKEQKADKLAIKAEVDKLVAYKVDYKTASGKEWTADLNNTVGGDGDSDKTATAGNTTAAPNISPSQTSASDVVGLDILKSIKTQGDTIRQMKDQKASKDAVKAEVDKLNALKKDYKAASGKEWTVELNALVDKPATTVEPSKTTVPKDAGSDSNSVNQQQADSSVAGYDILKSIKTVGDTIRQMKEQKVSKDAIKAEVDKLNALKKDYRTASGKEWTVELNALVDNKPIAVAAELPKTTVPTDAVSNAGQQPDSSAAVAYDILKSIKTVGDTIRQMKEQKASKDAIKAEVDKLVALKKDYKTASGKEWTVECNTLV